MLVNLIMLLTDSGRARHSFDFFLPILISLDMLRPHQWVLTANRISDSRVNLMIFSTNSFDQVIVNITVLF